MSAARHMRLSGLEPLVVTPELLFINVGERTNVTGSAAIRLRKVVMACSESSMPSSMLTSRICAPLSTCWRATSTASS